MKYPILKSISSGKVIVEKRKVAHSIRLKKTLSYKTFKISALYVPSDHFNGFMASSA